MMFLEIGYNQKEEVQDILKRNSFRNTICLQDFAGNDRVVIAG